MRQHVKLTDSPLSPDWESLQVAALTHTAKYLCRVVSFACA